MRNNSSALLFSQYFSIPQTALDEAGLIDPFLKVDTPLFIDPVLLEKSSNPIIANQALGKFKDHFANFVRLVAISEAVGDAPWRAASKLLDLSEPAEIGLGHGRTGRSGSSRPPAVSRAIMQTTKEVLRLGLKDPEMVSLMGFFEKDIGPDTISDFTGRVIANELAIITEAFCQRLNIPVFINEITDNHKLPKVIDHRGNEKTILLVPKDIVRELPIANDWSDIERAINHNERLRSSINSFLAGIAQPTVEDRKKALRQIALASKENFESFLATVKEYVRTYDSNLDALSYYKLREILAKGFPGLKSNVNFDLSSGPNEVLKVVRETLKIFKHHVENGNLWEELWLGEQPKKERAAQLIYYAIADCFCRANNIDISPEANMGGGPVDFKFSSGYQAKVVVEMKRSLGMVKHGYERQLEAYMNAASTEFGVYVVMDFGNAETKLQQILEMQASRISDGKRAPEIVIIDATKKLSASKR